MPLLKPGRWAWNRSELAPEFREMANHVDVMVPFTEGQDRPWGRFDGQWVRASTATGAWSSQAMYLGPSYKKEASQNLSFPANTAPCFVGDVEWSLFLTVNRINSDGLEAYVTNRTSATLAAGIWLLRESSSDLVFSMRDGSAWNAVTWTAPGQHVAGQQSLLITRRAGGVYELFFDGQSKGTQTNAASVGALTSQQLNFGTLHAADTGNGVYAHWQSFVTFNKALTSTDALRLHNDPFGLIRRRIPIETYGTAPAAPSAPARNAIIFVAAD